MIDAATTPSTVMDRLKVALDRLKESFLLCEDLRLPELCNALAEAAGFKVEGLPKSSNDPDIDRMRHAVGALMRCVSDLRYKPPELWGSIVNGHFLQALTDFCNAMESEVDRP